MSCRASRLLTRPTQSTVTDHRSRNQQEITTLTDSVAMATESMNVTGQTPGSHNTSDHGQIAAVVAHHEFTQILLPNSTAGKVFFMVIYLLHIFIQCML